MTTQTQAFAPAASASHIRRHHAGFWIVSSAFMTAMAFAAVPTPLYAIYQQRDGFPSYVITIIFAAYAVGVILALYLAGHVSDWLGRRRLVLASLAIEALSAVIFMFWNDVAGLLVARLVSGIGIGTLTAAATAHLGELRRVSHPHEEGRVSGTVSTAVNLGGIALGPLLGGLLSQFLPAPLFSPFAVFLVIMVVAIVLLAFVPETVDTVAARRPYAPQKIAVPAEARGAFTAAAIGAAAAFSVMGLFTALTGSIVIGLLHLNGHLIAGLVAFAAMGASAVSQLVSARMSRRGKLQLGVALMVVGLVIVAVVGFAPSLPLLLVGGVAAGAGVGLVFTASVAVAVTSARPENRSEVLSGLFLVAYAGISVPVIAVGVALAFFPIADVLTVFALVVLAIVVISAIPALRRR